MARRRKRRQAEEVEERFELHPDTKRGIVAVALFAASALLFLSFLTLAGSLGAWIDAGLSAFFGWDRFLLPVIMVIVGATLIFPERGTLSGWNYVGLLTFFLSFNTLLNLILVNRPSPFTEDLTQAGGLLGQLLGLSLPSMLGGWGALILCAALLAVSVMLAFNTSLRRLAGVHEHLLGWFGAILHKETLAPRDVEVYEGETEEPEELGELEGEEDEGGEEEPKKKLPPAKAVTMPAGEKALLVKERREVIIPIDLLEKRTGKADSGDLKHRMEVIEKTFEQFGIEVEMGEASVGPTVTQFTLRPAQGVKLARIVGLTNDLALALEAHPIRIEAPIPGKALVGIEVPNKSVATVGLRDLIESRPFQTRTSNLTLPLGKDVSGNVSVVALDKMPHMLVAGSTGSGKSVALNTFILSLLYENGPDDLKLILVDPKRVEMGVYEGIPHLLVPPITKGDDTVNALKWTVREMERRLDVLSKFGARDINSFNAKAEEKMPKVVLIIDELADLMQTSGREVEALVVRIAQMARAVGIHLILATQRPSVDVITGLIKANVPARVAFAVASQMDSRTILDASGAEKLLGRGDMLFTCAEISKPRRLQGAYVSEEECARVVAFLKGQGAPDYNHAITKPAPSGSVFDADGDDGDPLLDDAVAVVLQSGKASTSLLQRRLKVGYGRAARIMDLMEERGVIGPGEGAKPREILIEEWPPAPTFPEGEVGVPTPGGASGPEAAGTEPSEEMGDEGEEDAEGEEEGEVEEGGEEEHNDKE